MNNIIDSSKYRLNRCIPSVFGDTNTPHITGSMIIVVLYVGKIYERCRLGCGTRTQGMFRVVLNAQLNIQ
ncbi:EC1118_1O4_3169p [Saccharomyces cerevisiae EC1118]|uniref:EC1118_1O4_3169p n=1 Tax=Saccharomyces cerevisiae (strain Lalvin EC1118 / Prise de mousse) TaxID=643680 RepID=C8ZI70_YEAS8|nr:EC1118_1O4_3169p [Saccharomyces cerevisiae EC1118]